MTLSLHKMPVKINLLDFLLDVEVAFLSQPIRELQHLASKPGGEKIEEFKGPLVGANSNSCRCVSETSDRLLVVLLSVKFNARFC